MLSINETLVKAVAVFELINVKVRVVVPPAPMVAGAKALVTVGKDDTEATVKIAVLLPAPAPVSAAATGLVAFGQLPAILLVIATVRVQLAPPARLILVTVTMLLPTVGVGLGVQVPPTFSGLASLSCEGRLSVKLMLLRAVAGFGLAMVKVRVEVPLTVIEVGAKSLVTVG